MKQDLTTGVHLTVIPTTQFKTVSLLVSFCSPVTLATLTQRSLLADLLETSSHKYPTQTALASKLSSLYGANYSTNVMKTGELGQFQFGMTVPNGRYLEGQPDLLKDAVTFLNEMINFPLQSSSTPNAFDDATFDRQKKNLATALKSVSEDKMLYTRLQTQQLHFGNVAAAFPSAGRLEDVDALTATNVFAELNRMREHDEVYIYVLGDVTDETVVAALENLHLAPRPATHGQLAYHMSTPKALKQQVEHQPITQAKLDLIYHFPVDYGQAMYYPAQVFNALFGGTPLSLLFTNVREKQSLAYYANSSVNFFNQTLTVQTGIDGDNAEQVKQIINEQLAALAAGKMSEQRFQQVKETLINQREAAQDAPRMVIGAYLMDDLAQSPISVADWINGIEAVTMNDVALVARLATLATSYLLRD
ncbi:EF-P 5-aminopentanol modification-associated protein YfmF [Furfurilactobacillus siliginis]|uniref:Peptidase M16 n=1 Tax=Furfurilactobacillus siliginis TaxID=348151 RepID=A0A0R2L103_9LACO|nr:pitrilysin family protein [Furfurilactobacillus siliginis]KRN95467.1 hypothetical protein IV55_GL001927 [Furfurilactobacillus siliginis]GEK28240.1 peptidase M16 [Furfurilactobacillus siliginis]